VSVAKVALQELAVSLRADLTHADKHAAELATWTTAAPNGYEVYAAATLLHHLYSAIESIVERSLKVFDGAVPDGEGSHIQLLERAAAPLDGVRDVILPKNEVVDELRRFRHRFRKRYDVDLEPARLQPVIKSAVAEWPTIRAHLATFAAFVDECVEVAV
jgi:hypothetical protein